MGQLRQEKIQEFIKQEISKMILTELKDPRIGFVTVTQVEASADFRSAKVYVSLLGSDDQKAETWAGLTKSLGFIRAEIGKRIRMRFAPVLSLHLDETLEYSARIQELYGVNSTFSLGHGRVPVKIEVLAPNQRPIQVTDDLSNFWREQYPKVKAELSRRYPRHEWR